VAVYISHTSYGIQQKFEFEPPALFHKKPCVLITFDGTTFTGVLHGSLSTSPQCRETVFEEMIFFISLAHTVGQYEICIT
jgi:hypothetical protein